MLLLVPYSSIESVLAVEAVESVSSVEAGESGKAALTIRATTAAFPTSCSPIKEGKGALKEPPAADRDQAADRAGRGAATSFARRSSGFCGSSGKSFSRNCRYGNWGCYTSFFRETQKSSTKAATKVRAPTTSIAGATTSFAGTPECELRLEKGRRSYKFVRWRSFRLLV